ncbi:MAG: hypothetical protein GXO87_12930, partial [Chlorobi bacterium]|nr:hypothetical protein [Chlorobiota bacterium]
MKKYNFLILFVFFFLTYSNIFSQSEIDSLKNIFETAKTSIEKLDALLNLAQALKNTNNSEIIKFLDQADALLKKNPDLAKSAKLDRYYANYYSYKSDYKKATEYFLQSIQKAEDAEDYELRNRAINDLAILNVRTKNYKKGIELFQKLLDYSKETENEEDVTFYSLNLAMANAE